MEKQREPIACWVWDLKAKKWVMAKFHTWGQDNESCEYSAPIVVAVVQYESDGRCECVSPKQVCFHSIPGSYESR
jgi:hypothetical protein